MSRFAEKLSVEELKSKIVEFYNKKIENDPDEVFEKLSDKDLMPKDERALYYLFLDLSSYLKLKIFDDIFDKVNVNTENVDIQHYVVIDENCYAIVSMGGDWQVPVFFAVYWDGTELRAYVPKILHNYNTINNCAFGEDEECDEEYCEKYKLATSELDSRFNRWGNSLPNEFIDAIRKRISVR